MAGLIMRLQRLYDRLDKLGDACHCLRHAAEALKQCPDADHAENLEALEQIRGELTMELNAVHASIERLERSEADDL